MIEESHRKCEKDWESERWDNTRKCESLRGQNKRKDWGKTTCHVSVWVTEREMIIIFYSESKHHSWFFIGMFIDGNVNCLLLLLLLQLFLKRKKKIENNKRIHRCQIETFSAFFQIDQKRKKRLFLLQNGDHLLIQKKKKRKIAGNKLNKERIDSK